MSQVGHDAIGRDALTDMRGVHNRARNYLGKRHEF